MPQIRNNPGAISGLDQQPEQPPIHQGGFRNLFSSRQQSAQPAGLQANRSADLPPIYTPADNGVARSVYADHHRLDEVAGRFSASAQSRESNKSLRAFLPGTRNSGHKRSGLPSGQAEELKIAMTEAYAESGSDHADAVLHKIRPLLQISHQGKFEKWIDKKLDSIKSQVDRSDPCAS